MEKSKLLDRCGAEGEDRLLLAKVLDRAAQAEERNIPACTDFLSPQQQMMAVDLLRLAGIPETAWLRQADFLLSSWNSAGRARLTVTEIPAAHLHIPEVRCEEVRDTVSSLRLDAVCSTGFRMARGKAADLISSGHVQVNWRPCTKADKLLTEGDTVSARGFGKFQLAAVGGVTKKGRTAIVVKRYI